MLKICHGSGVNFFPTAPFITDDFAAFHADERGDVADCAKFLGNFPGDELTVGEDLEIGVGMIAKNVQDLLVHEGFTSKDSKKAIPGCFGFIDHFVHGRDVELVLLGFDVDPAALTLQIAAIDDGNVEEWRKEFTLFHPLFVEHDGAGTFDPQVPEKFPNEAFVRLEQNTFCHL